MAATTLDCLIGIVGYSPVLDAYPLGPRLMKGLQRRFAGRSGITVENMTWGPIHIVQHFQDETGPKPRRLVLVAGAPTSSTPGSVSAYRWAGGMLHANQLQERIYEAVTGIVDIDNTLAIGEHFGIWPGEVFSVEVDLHMNCFGDMVIADSGGQQSDVELSKLLGFSPAAAIGRIVDICEALALGSVDAATVGTKTALPLERGQSFTQYRIQR